MAETVPLALPPPLAAARLRHYIGADGAMDAARRAIEDGWVRVSGSPARPPAVTVQHVSPYLRSATAVHPLRWLVGHGTGASSVLLDANLEIDPVHDGSTALSLPGSFRRSTLGLDAGVPSGGWSEVSRVVVLSFLARVADSLHT